MASVSKSDLLVGILSSNVETGRVVEHGLVTVCGGVGEEHSVAPADRRAGEVPVLLGSPQKVFHGAHPADDLFGGVTDEVGIVSESLQLCGVLGKCLESSSDRATGRVVAGSGDNQVQAES